ncbi:MAG TPA: hypothetical protein ENI66_00465 [Candidatus Yonathbacteria bacterium]|nr:hypothetical protein [Candidatus Yonathbacteria bacterium]
MSKIITKKIKSQNRHWKNFLDKDYLGSHNLEIGEEMLLTIARFEGEEKVKTKEGEKIKMVLYFKEEVQKMILNITNANTLTTLYGSHPEDWIGKQVSVHSMKVKAFGSMVDALRIRDIIPKMDVDVAKTKEFLSLCQNLDELKKNWSSLSAYARANSEVSVYKELLKTKLATA